MGVRQPFIILGSASIDKFVINESGQLRYADNDRIATTRESLECAINNGIVVVKKRNNTQLAMLKALYALGLNWLVMASSGTAFASVEKPEKGTESWKLTGEIMYISNKLPMKVLSEMVCWSDKEPLSIREVLIDNGEDVDGDSK